MYYKGKEKRRQEEREGSKEEEEIESREGVRREQRPMLPFRKLRGKNPRREGS